MIRLGSLWRLDLALRPAAHATAVLWITTFAVAVLTATVPGAPAALRDAFGFRLADHRGVSLADAATYFTTNLRVTTSILVAAWVRPRCPAAALLDLTVAVMLAANVALVGAVLGAYGVAALPWLIHVPVEWAAVGVAVGGYAAARRRGIGLVGLAYSFFLAVVLLAAAASIETWWTP